MNSQQQQTQSAKSLVHPDLSPKKSLLEKGITPLKNLTAQSAFVADLQRFVARVEMQPDKKGVEGAVKAMGYQVGAAGGWLLNRVTAQELLEIFYAKTVIREAGARIIDMSETETITFNRQIGGVSAYWGAQGVAGADSTPTFGVVTLQLREAIAETLIPTRLLKHSTFATEQLIIDDLSREVALLIDRSALYGTGRKPAGASTGSEPLGVKNFPDVTVTAISTNGSTLKASDMVNGFGAIQDANVPEDESWGAIVHPRTARTMKNTTDTTGQLIPFDRFSQGYKVLDTTSVPINLTTGTNSDTSDVFFGAWSRLFFGTSGELELTLDTSRYVRERQVLLQAVMYVDISVSHPQAFRVLTGVRGG